MSVKSYSPFLQKLQQFTESVLTKRKARLRIKKEKQQSKNPILDWIEAFIWAAGVVLLINQFLFQAYQIPSGSMIDTLLERDRIFVNKLIYGPEVLPGIGKLPSPIKPKREDVIIFESPEYFSNGPVFDIAQRIIYMLTLSLVDIDKNESGGPRVHFLIKRAAGMGGDLIQNRNGEFYFRFKGEDRWTSERDYLAKQGFTHNLSRLIQDNHYPAMEAIGKSKAYLDLGLIPPPELSEKTDSFRSPYFDSLSMEKARYAFLRCAYPQDPRYRSLFIRQESIYVPEDSILPLGDNRDFSHDGRFFGTVKASKILGRGAFKYWPLSRLGGIH
ncbi:MAG: signal peptidase I [Treponema sp.]|nr:signal peptidase I [Treponema sp.]